MSKSWRQVLEDTDWDGLSHAYGPASDTPGHLRALVEGGPDERKAASSHLVSAIIHQGTIWPATHAATSVVLGMLRDAQDAVGPSRPDMIAFLVEVEEEGLGQFSEEHWREFEAMAARESRQATIADWTAIEDDVSVDTHYARAMLGMRELLPDIRRFCEPMA